MNDSVHDPLFHKLIAYLARVPAVATNETRHGGFGTGLDGGTWWLKFSLDLDHPLAWNVVQEMGHVLNYLSVEEKLPTTFKPVSPPPYMNGGPREFLSWLIECPLERMEPDKAAEWLEGGLPRPVDDLAEWDDGEE